MSPRPIRAYGRVSSVLLASLMVLTTGPMAVPTVAAQPATSAPADPRSDGLDDLRRLSEEAGALGEELHTAQIELDAARAEQYRSEVLAGVWQARADLADVRAARDQHTVDSIAVMHYRGGGTDATRAAVLASDPRDLVDRLAVLQVLSGATTGALDRSRGQLSDARRVRDESRQATAAAAEATRVAEDRTRAIEATSAELRGRMDEVRRRVDALTTEQRQQWVGGPLVPEGYSAPAADGVNGAALQAALSRIGMPYSWGATGPSEFDCSGLMVWSYAQVGKTLPRSSQAQSGAGAPVAQADMQPGDLVIYFPGATHVGMYAGNGLVVHAPDYGIPVKLEKVDAMPIHSIRRY